MDPGILESIETIYRCETSTTSSSCVGLVSWQDIARGGQGNPDVKPWATDNSEATGHPYVDCGR